MFGLAGSNRRVGSKGLNPLDIGAGVWTKDGEVQVRNRVLIPLILGLVFGHRYPQSWRLMVVLIPLILGLVFGRLEDAMLGVSAGLNPLDIGAGVWTVIQGYADALCLVLIPLILGLVFGPAVSELRPFFEVLIPLILGLVFGPWPVFLHG